VRTPQSCLACTDYMSQCAEVARSPVAGEPFGLGRVKSVFLLALSSRNPRKLTFLIPDLLGRAAEHRKPIAWLRTFCPVQIGSGASLSLDTQEWK